LNIISSQDNENVRKLTFTLRSHATLKVKPGEKNDAAPAVFPSLTFYKPTKPLLLYIKWKLRSCCSIWTCQI